MDDKKLESLRDIPVPPPSERARQAAFLAAREAFEAEKIVQHEKNAKIVQGNAQAARPIHSSTHTLWRRIMNKQWITGGALASVLAVTVSAIVWQQHMAGQQLEKTLPANVADEAQDSANNTETNEISARPKPQSESRVDTEVGVSVSGAALAPPAEFAEPIASAPISSPPMAKQERSKIMTNRAPAGMVMDQMMESPVSVPAYEGRDQFAHEEINPLRKVSEEPVSTFSIDVDTASYSFVRGALNNGMLPQKDAVRTEEMINYFDYQYARPDSAERPFEPTVALYPSPWNKGTQLLHIGIQGHEVAQAEKPHSNLVFLIDISGSMVEPNKLPLLKNAFRLMVENLEAEDTVAIVTYAGNAGTVLEPTKVANKQAILDALEQLEGGGSTAGAQGIKQAYALAKQNFDEEGVNRVILATDGDFNVGITDTEELKGYVERERESGIFLSVLGFGRGNYNDELMQILAQNGNGNAAYIDTLNEARKVLVEEAGSTLFPIAKDVKLQVEFNPQAVSEYRLIGYETRMLNREDFNNDKVDAGDIGSGHTVTAIYEITPRGSDAEELDDLRYQTNAESAQPKNSAQGEYGFLKIRYKLPSESKSRLIELPITAKAELDNLLSAPDDIRFAASVAGFGQLLRGDTRLGDYSYDDVIKLAQGAKGEDEFGYRAEFINLVRLAKSAQPM